MNLKVILKGRERINKIGHSIKLMMKSPDKLWKSLKLKGLNSYITNYNVYKDPFKPRIGPNALFFLTTWFKEKIAGERTRIANEAALKSKLMKFKLEDEEEPISYLDKIKDRIMEK